MSENIQIGLMLLSVGLPTVFLVLLLVIGLGKVLILAVNKYAPDETPAKVVLAVNQSVQDISPTKMSAIVSAVNIVTRGKGKVTKIEKL